MPRRSRFAWSRGCVAHKRAIGFDADRLCQACITGHYPSTAGQKLYQIALANAENGTQSRTYESPIAIGNAERPLPAER